MENAIAANFQEFLAEPSAERFMHLRDVVSQSPGYAPYSGALRKAHQLLREDRTDEAKNFLLSVMPSRILNPGIHQLLSFVYHQLGQVRAAQIEYAVAIALVNGILSTGDSSEASPYLVLHTDDEYDVLQHLGKRSEGQALVQKGERNCDRQTCDDGSEIWFDVTLPLQNLQRQLPTIV